MWSEPSDALERDAQYYQDRSNLFAGAEAAGLLDLAGQCREDAQRVRERPHEHLAQTTRAAAAERETAADARSSVPRVVEDDLDDGLDL